MENQVDKILEALPKPENRAQLLIESYHRSVSWITLKFDDKI